MTERDFRRLVANTLGHETHNIVAKSFSLSHMAEMALHKMFMNYKFPEGSSEYKLQREMDHLEAGQFRFDKEGV